MHRFRLCQLICLLTCGPAWGNSECAAEPFPGIGQVQRDFHDPERRNWIDTGPRPLRTTLYFPTDGAIESDVPSNRNSTYPLILVSHGSGQSSRDMEWLARPLAQAGYLVVAVSHNGTFEEEDGGPPLSLSDFFGWERARDLSVVLDRLLNDSHWGQRIDDQRIGAAGFSLGGATVIWLGGARFDLERLKTHSPPPPERLKDRIEHLIQYAETNPIGIAASARADASHRDPRIKSIFALAPAIGAGFPPEGLSRTAVPVQIVVGAEDLVAPARENAAHYAAHIPQAKLITLTGERGHYTRPIEATQRDRELAEVSQIALTFFGETLPQGQPQNESMAKPSRTKP